MGSEETIGIVAGAAIDGGISGALNWSVQRNVFCGKVSKTVRVGRWMSEDEYQKMLKTGKVQTSPNGNTTYVAYPSDKSSFEKQAHTGSVYVEFDVDSDVLQPAGKEGWKQIPGPGSLWDRLCIKTGKMPVTEMPNAYNIKKVGKK